MSERIDDEATPRDDCCCSVVADPRISRYFDRKIASRLAAGKTLALGPVSRELLADLSDVRDIGPTVLELGCGAGALTVALIEAGATEATGVDLSAASIGAAERRAAAAGLAGRASFRRVDGAAARLEPHDWVVLDKVLCCYRELDALLSNSIGAARHRYAFAVPDSRGVRGVLNRIWVRLEDATNALRGRPCPGYVHDLQAIEGRLGEAGFRRIRSRTAGLWYIGIFERPLRT